MRGFKRQTSAATPVSVTLLQEGALIIAENWELKDSPLLMVCWSVAWEEDVNSMTLESWKERSRELIRAWEPENICNIDETGSLWKGPPEVSLNKKGSRCSGEKQSNQRNTWAFFSMRQVEKKIIYQKKKHRRQPFDSGTIASWRWSYKKRLSSHVCSKVDGSNSASDIVKSVEWGRQAWDDVSKELGSTIKKLRRRTILLGEKHFQDRRNSLRQWKYPVLQKRF